MKRTKKFASLLLALVMVLSMSMTAFATSGGEENQNPTDKGGTITINDAVPGETYRAYQILYLESYNATTNAYSYKANSNWKTWLEANATEYLEFDTQGYVKWKTDAQSASLAALLKGQLTGKTPDATATAPDAAQGQTYSTVKLPSEEGKSLTPGYYLVDTSLGTLCSLDTTNPDAIIEEKNVEPTIEKKVQEGENFEGSNTAKIGDTVNFKTTIHAHKGARNYVLHDKMEAGLTLNEDSISVGGATVTTDYIVNTNPECGHEKEGTKETYDCTFTITFKQEYLDKITDNTKDIVVTYSATLNKDAEIADATNDNKTMLDYGNNSHTEWSSTTTKTFKFDIVKTDSNKKLLDGAKFELYDAKENGSKISLVKISDGSYRVATATESGAEGFESAVIEAKGGQATVQGLDAKSYWLEETEAPKGYNRLQGRTEIRIENANLTASINDNNTWNEGGVHIINQTGSALPDTGGMGTRIFYVVGGILVLGAVVLLIAKRRMNAEK